MPGEGGLPLLRRHRHVRARSDACEEGYPAGDRLDHDCDALHRRRPDKIPGHLAPAQLGAYIEYAADVVQIAPAIVLTTVGIVLALPDNMSPVTASSIMMVMALIAADTIVLSMAPHKYVIRNGTGTR